MELPPILKNNSSYFEGNPLHNALRQVVLREECGTIQGFSISGLSTYLQLPEWNICFDMGECPLSAVPLDHVFLTHAHGDHSRCLMRHESLRRMLGIPRPPVYFVPAGIAEQARRYIEAEANFEGSSTRKHSPPKLIAVAEGERYPLPHRQDLEVTGFPVTHSQPSMGFTIWQCRKKLRPELLGLSRSELLERKANGESLTYPLRIPKFTYIGDCVGSSLREQSHIWKSEYLFLECTFLDDDELEMATQKGHTHLQEIVEVLEELGEDISCKIIVLKHFSMKYSRNYILRKVEEKIPCQFKERIRLLV